MTGTPPTRGRIAAVAAAAVTAGLLAACGGGSQSGPARPAATAPSTATVPTAAPTATTAAPAPVARPAPRPVPILRPAARSSGLSGLLPVVSVGGRVAASIARIAAPDGSGSTVTLLSFDQQRVHLVLHAGSIDPGGTGWLHGPAIGRGEARKLVAAFNGGFRLSTGSGGFREGQRVGAPIQAGLGSIVTYADGRTEIGTWGSDVPAPGTRVASVRQNLMLLIAHGAPAGTLGCRICWGATLGGGDAVARAALAVTADGSLLWAAGEHLTPTALAAVLVEHGAQSAVELDINPSWVAGYVYGHSRAGLTAVPVVAGQLGIPGAFLSPYGRDFFAVVSAG